MLNETSLLYFAAKFKGLIASGCSMVAAYATKMYTESGI